MDETCSTQQGPQIGAPKEIESTVAKERMVKIVHLNSQAAKDAQMILDLLNERPELDMVFCRLFGIRPEGATQPGQQR